MSEVKSKSAQSWGQKLFWPIFPSETSKVFVMIVMLSAALFNYTCLRIIKDALVMTSYGASKDVLPFLKGFFVLPATLFFVKKFWDLSDSISKKNLFYATLFPFLIFFIIFSVFVYPFVDHIHASHATIDAWQAAYPRFHYVFPVFGNIAFSLFYVCAELWGNVIISLLFWNFANAAISKEDAKRVFPVFATYSNFGLIAGGLVSWFFADAAIKAKKLGAGGRIDSTTAVLACVVISGIIFAYCYWLLNERILKKEGFDINATKVTKKKEKVTFAESLHMLFTSKYLMYVTILVLAYGMTANLVEVTWKGMIQALYPDSNEYKIFMCKFFVCTGISTSIIGFCCKGVVKRFGWLFGSLVTPAIMLVTSVAFYVFILFGQYILPASIAAASIYYAIVIGSAQNILSKGAKYTLFDPTVQMAYQPLDEEQKIKGKAAVDVIGGRAGKSLGSYLQNFVVSVVPAYQQSAFMVLVVGLCIAWIYASIALSKEYSRLTDDKLKSEPIVV